MFMENERSEVIEIIESNDNVDDLYNPENIYAKTSASARSLRDSTI